MTTSVKPRPPRKPLLYFGVIFFGHLGLGDALAAPARRDLPRRWVLLGTVAPDLLDKPLYFGLSWARGHRGLGIVHGTRSFGHTFLLAGLVWWAGRARGDARLKGLALGMATHPVLDFLSDLAAFGPASAARGSAAFWPLTGWGFPVPTYAGLGEHLRALASPVLLSCEAAGLLWLVLSAAAGRRAGRSGPSSTSNGPSGRA